MKTRARIRLFLSVVSAIAAIVLIVGVCAVIFWYRTNVAEKYERRLNITASAMAARDFALGKIAYEEVEVRKQQYLTQLDGKALEELEQLSRDAIDVVVIKGEQARAAMDGVD